MFGMMFGVGKSAAAIAVATSTKDPFVLPRKHQRQQADGAKVAISKGSQSDYLTFLNALQSYDQSRRRGAGGSFRFCNDYFLSNNTMGMISELRRNVSRELVSMGMGDLQKEGGNWVRSEGQVAEGLLMSSLAAGLYPNVVMRQGGEVNFSTALNRKCKIHLSSVNSLRGQPLAQKCGLPPNGVEYALFGEIVKQANGFSLRNTSRVWSIVPILLLCGKR